MKKTLTSVLPALLVLAVSTAAQAGTTPSPTVKQLTLAPNGTFLQSPLIGGKVNAVTDFDFTLTKAATDINVKINSTQNFAANTMLSLYEGATLSSAALLTSKALAKGLTTLDYANVSNLHAGNYYIVVNGSGTNAAVYGGAVTVTPSAVPLPAALPLFGAGLFGLGALARRRQAKKAV